MTGTARLKDGKLTITTQRKRGKGLVPLVVTYAVADSKPDPRVANPAFILTKENGQAYHVSLSEFGVRCDCVDGEIRERRGTGLCKHAKALAACGLIPK